MKLAAALLLLLLVVAPAAHAVQYIVGDTNGWESSVDYTTWVQGKTFTVGDTLLFNYGGTHAVDEVTQSGYNGCSSGNAIATHNDGSTVIPLSSPGTRYFICPTPGHCSGGMKLAVNVVAAGGNSPSTPSSPSGPSPSTPSGTPSGGSTPSQPTARPSGSGAPSIMNYGFMLAFWPVLGAVLAIMS